MGNDDKKKDGDLDKSLFEKATKGAKKIQSQTVEPWKKQPPPKPLKRESIEGGASDAGVIVYDDTPGHGAEEKLFYAVPGPQNKIIRKLRAGQLPPEAKLDLHRQTLAVGAELVHEFIDSACQAGCRVVLIIHGKGTSTPHEAPKMKNQVVKWLQNHDDVLAYCSAQPSDGGAGAVYVLLRRR